MQLFSGAVDDRVFMAAQVKWMEMFTSAVRKVDPKASVVPNFSLMPYMFNYGVQQLRWDDPLVLRLGNATDGILDEVGFSALGLGPKPALSAEEWENSVRYMENTQAGGKAYFTINCQPLPMPCPLPL